MGYASTQILDADAIDLLVDGARENALLIESEDRQFLHPGDDSYVQLDTFHPELNDLPTAEKIAMARTLEQLTLEQYAALSDLLFPSQNGAAAHL